MQVEGLLAGQCQVGLATMKKSLISTFVAVVAIAGWLIASALGISLPFDVGGSQPSGAYVDVAEQLDELPVKGRAPKTGYSREEFGPAWKDVDRNGCDTRNDILRRDLEDLTYKDDTKGCVVASGTLDDLYTGTTIDFVRGPDSAQVQIDHVVALSDAWQKGAQQLSKTEREALANDPLNLFASQGRANSQKGDGDAATWLPSNKDFRCQYVATQVAVKSKYSLWVTAAEKEAISDVLSGCTGDVPWADPVPEPGVSR